MALPQTNESALMPLQIDKPIALVGLMGVGKTTVGRRLAKRLTLVERVSRNDNRPLLQGVDKRAKMRELMEARHPIYAKAHVKIKIARGPHLRTVHRVMRALKSYQEVSNAAD